MRDFITGEIDRAAETLARLRADDALLGAIEAAAHACAGTLQGSGKLLLAGNGGSAADAQHLAAELVGRLGFERPGLAAIALTTDSSALTAIGNDYGFGEVFARQLDALGATGDVFVGISTSGRSGNLLRALEEARELGLVTVGLTGESGGDMAPLCDHLIRVPSSETQKIQEAHIVVGHILCGLVERALYSDETAG